MMPAGDRTADGRSRLEEIFVAALDLPVAERRSFVAGACVDDPALEIRVLRLLAAHETTSGPPDLPLSLLVARLLDDDDAAQHDGAATSIRPASMIGPYRIVRLIGRGGMGSVYMACRADGAFEQRVALNVINAGIVTDELERRFLRERQILARLDHPGIARLLHGGLTPEGHPYLAMELVEGEPITEWVRTRRPDVRERLRLFLQVCDAVNYAHRQLVVHRDLKPSNIIVTADGRARLLDFGIARLLGADGDDDLSTRTGLLLLTPEYAAPELLHAEPVTNVHGRLRPRRRPVRNIDRSPSVAR